MDLQIGHNGTTDIWPTYMVDLLHEVVQSWVERVEIGDLKTLHPNIPEQITTEHLRIAKRFIEATS